MTSPTPISAAVHPSAHVSPQARLGPGCRVESGAVVPAGSELGADVHVGPNVVFVEPVAGETVARAQAQVRVGANAVIYPGVVLATGVVVRPGAVVTQSVPHGAIVEGNPATIVGYVDSKSSRHALSPLAPSRGREPVQTTPVPGVTIHHMPVVPDLRGSLTVGEFQRDIPFAVQRYFMVFGVPSRETRGAHAHRQCHQFLICVHGNCSVVADDGRHRVEVRLDSIDTGLYLPPMVWGIQYQYSADAVLLVFASHHYDSSDYIRDYDEFLRAKAAP